MTIQASPGNNSYDEVPYSCQSHPNSHVRRLEAVATMFGMQPAPISRARVLELGCAAGHNLAPQAQDLPAAAFLGIDYSERQVAEGRTLVRELELANLEIRHASILDINGGWGKFDYIICHGVYSWVPAPVQQHILWVLRNLLAPQGVGFISYNVFPGWHARKMMREMMAYHTAPLPNARQKIDQARGLLTFLAELSPRETTYGALLRDELELLRKADDSYLFHEHLEECNEPLYFHQFAARLAAHELQYLGEAAFSAMLPNSLPPAAQQKLASLPLVPQQQYIDFVRNRPFRESLICQAEVSLNRRLTPESIAPFSVWLPTKFSAEKIDLASEAPEEFKFGSTTLTVPSPLVKAALLHLGELGHRSIALSELFAAACQRLPAATRPQGPARGKAEIDMRASLLLGMCCGIIEFAVHPPEYAKEVSSLPVAPPLARWQAVAGESVTNRRHENVRLDPVGRHLLRYLDGRHNIHDLAQSVREAAGRGDSELAGKLKPNLDGPTARHLVERALDHIQRHALLTE